MIPDFGRCPRCAAYAYEYLRTHSHCVNCNYSPHVPDYVVEEPDVPKWAIDFANELDRKEKTEAEKGKRGAGLELALTAGLLFILSSCGPGTERTTTAPVTAKENLSLKGDLREIPSLKNLGKLVLERDARLFIEDKDLEIDAEEIVSYGAVVQTFEPGGIASAAHGQNGGTIRIQAKRASGNLRILGNGQPGRQGSDGREGIPGISGEQGQPGLCDLKPNSELLYPLSAETRVRYKAAWAKNPDDYMAPYFYCSQQTGDGLPGQNGGDGAQGARGGNGGNSSKISVFIEELSPFHVEIEAIPGLPGTPGKGGRGGRGGAGGLPGIRDKSFLCDQAASGPQGKTGENGNSGLLGEPGKKSPVCVQVGDSKSPECHLFQQLPEIL